ncbi:hypothetical protein LJY25_11030 [Hymenobacter sp. BT175]|uniref:hypothetical protein n=1 Tax=Hymenobacter translucens TaxID=2886507 RepID=UPI001D0DC3C3|nr:hypothetical protein [Hymenobacter translucens]MCC2546980.1 hypothetical protein [Hymenobacter translucens]
MPRVTKTTRIRLRPADTSKVPFWGQMAIGGLWVAYTLFLIYSNTGVQDYHFLHYVFLVFSLVYIGYVLVHNAPIFGTQSYLEFTPGYIVHKSGLFRPKQVFAAETIEALDLLPMQLRLRLRSNDLYTLSLREVKGPKRRERFRGEIRQFAAQYNIPLNETAPQPRR